MLWVCDGCGAEKECAPLAHDDTGGKITVCGPTCQECDIPMDVVPNQDDHAGSLPPFWDDSGYASDRA